MKIFKEKKYSILRNILKYSFVLVFAASLLAPFIFVGAADAPGVTIDAKIENPLGKNGPQNLQDFIKKMIEIVLVVGVPVLALAIIYAGFLFVKAQGNSEELTKAKHALLYTVIGGVLLLGAFVIANAIQGTVKDIQNGV